MGLQGMINDVLKQCDYSIVDSSLNINEEKLTPFDHAKIARIIIKY